MKNKSRTIGVLVLIVALVAALFMYRKSKKNNVVPTQTCTPEVTTLQSKIATTGTVQPQNRLEIKPQINGRIEEVLVKEGEEVHQGEIIAWMSSTERASLLDAARSRGQKEQEAWQDVYKPTPLIAPLQGTVIVRGVEPGQTVTMSDVVFVLSDTLLVQALVDETDIGKVRRGQRAVITLDAYPELKIPARVSHIAYESKINNNVTTYEVDILPTFIPSVFRSGMSASIDIIEKTKENVLAIPVEAVHENRRGTFVLVMASPNVKPHRRKVKLGMSDDKNIEVVEGLTADDKVVVSTQQYALSDKKQSGNPFMPQRRGGQRSSGKSKAS